MCVIAFSPKGVDAPTEEKIRQMFRANPDGAGYAYEQGNKVKYKKGFMTVDALLKELQPLKQWKNKNIAIHFRIGTAGENDKYTCHPFKISSKYHELRRLEGEGPVLFHNGIIENGGMVDENSSDTQDFVVAFAPLLEKYSKSKTRDLWMEKVIKGNRMLLMYGRNKYKLYGDWKKDGDLIVSNTNYMGYSSYGYGYGYGCGYGYGYGCGSYEQYFSAKDEAKKIYDELAKSQYLYLDEEQMEILLEFADDYTSDTVEKDGMRYGYSYEAGCVWSELAMY